MPAADVERSPRRKSLASVRAFTYPLPQTRTLPSSTSPGDSHISDSGMHFSLRSAPVGGKVRARWGICRASGDATSPPPLLHFRGGEGLAVPHLVTRKWGRVWGGRAASSAHQSSAHRLQQLRADQCVG